MDTDGAAPLSRPVHRLKRPVADFLTLADLQHVLRCAWHLGSLDRKSYANALRVETAIFTGLRGAELRNLKPRNLRDDGTVVVERGKGAKPRLAAFVLGRGESPTLAKLRAYVVMFGVPPDEPIWTTTHGAWHHWVVRRLGAETGLQRRVQVLSPDGHAPRYFVHPHAFRAGWVLICRRLPRAYGRPPVSWETIMALGGWTNLNTVLRSYYWVDMDTALTELDDAFSGLSFGLTDLPPLPTRLEGGGGVPPRPKRLSGD